MESISGDVETPRRTGDCNSVIVRSVLTRRQPLPGFLLAMDVSRFGRQLLTFKAIEIDPVARVLRRGELSTNAVNKSGDKL